MIALAICCLALACSLAALLISLSYWHMNRRIIREHDGVVMPFVKRGALPPTVPHRRSGREYMDVPLAEPQKAVDIDAEPVLPVGMPEWLLRNLADRTGD